MLIGITRQAHIISNRKYLNKAIKTEAVTTFQIVSFILQINLILTGFYFLGYEINLEANKFLGKIVIN